jgi:hypothetical protein
MALARTKLPTCKAVRGKRNQGSSGIPRIAIAQDRFANGDTVHAIAIRATKL